MICVPALPIMRVCNVCGESKPLEEFYAKAGSRDGLARHCKKCESLASKAWRRDNPLKVQENNRAYKAALRAGHRRGRPVFPRLDFTGQRLGRLLVLYACAEPKLGWHVLCDCGTAKTTTHASLLHGTKSCGCLQRDVTSSIARWRVDQGRLWKLRGVASKTRSPP